MALIVWPVVTDISPLSQSSCQGRYSRLLQKGMSRMGPPELDWRVHAYESLGDEGKYQRELLMVMMVTFTHQLGKKIPQ
jgi:hypothetical protein